MHLEDRHRTVVIGGVPRLHEDSVLSHISAAVLHGLPLWRTDVSRVHVTRLGATTRTTKRTRFSGAPLTLDEVTWIDGYRVTSLDRTVLDIARSLPFEQAVVVGDAGIHKGAQVKAVPDVRSEQARRILAFLDGRAESPGESRSRVLMDRLRIAKPQSQITILDMAGRFIARVDFCWPEFGLVGEFDGLLKYKAVHGEDSSAVVADEKRREDRLRAAVARRALGVGRPRPTDTDAGGPTKPPARAGRCAVTVAGLGIHGLRDRASTT